MCLSSCIHMHTHGSEPDLLYLLVADLSFCKCEALHSKGHVAGSDLEA